MPPAGQAKLLRAIQDGEFERLGDEQATRVDVRVVASTNSDLEAEVQQGQLPRRPLLPPERRADRRAAAARAPGRHPAPRPPLRRRRSRRGSGGRRPSSRRRRWRGSRLPLAGQRARAAQRDRARDDPRPARTGSRTLDLGSRAPAAPPPSGRALAGRELNLRDALNRLERELLLEAHRRAGGVRKEAAHLLGHRPAQPRATTCASTTSTPTPSRSRLPAPGGGGWASRRSASCRVLITQVAAPGRPRADPGGDPRGLLPPLPPRVPPPLVAELAGPRRLHRRLGGGRLTLGGASRLLARCRRARSLVAGYLQVAWLLLGAWGLATRRRTCPRRHGPAALGAARCRWASRRSCSSSPAASVPSADGAAVPRGGRRLPRGAPSPSWTGDAAARRGQHLRRARPRPLRAPTSWPTSRLGFVPRGEPASAGCRC